MSDFNVGDLVEARKGELVIRDRVVMKSYGLALGAMNWSLRDVRLNGYTLSLVEAATLLPLEPGHYLLDFSLTSHVYTLSVDGYWWDGSVQVSEEKMQYQVANAVTDPVRLESVPDIARKVIDATIRTFNSRGGNIVDALILVSQEFGVSDARG